MRSRRGEHGIVLLAMVAMIAMGAAWFTVSQLNALTSDHTIANRKHNAAVLARAKQALIGHVAMQAAKAGETDPGRLPCPEAAGYIGGGLEGATTGTCTFPAIGRLPWRTVGMEKLLDASGEPLWYVVASGWALGANLVINSNCTSDATMACNTGLLTVDGVRDTVALIIAPGQAMNVLASAGCTARTQARAAPAPAMDARDYLECYDSATSTFVTLAASSSFNDHVVKITAAELLPAIETAIADRLQREWAPLIKNAYSTNPWAATTVLPFAASFADPTLVPAPASNFRGAAATFQGLPPLTYAFTASPGSASACTPTPCTPTACVTGTDSRCDPGFVTWENTGTVTVTRTGGATLMWPPSGVATAACAVAGTPATLTCWIYTYWASMNFTIAVKATNVGMALRQVNATVPITGVDTALNAPYGYSLSSATLNNDGSATVVLSSRLPNPGANPINDLFCGLGIWGSCRIATITIPMALLSDHPLVDPSNTAYNWFTRNRWHELSYYAVASGIAPSGARSCTTGTNCLRLTRHSDDGKHRGLFFIGGAKIGTQPRPPLVRSDLLEDANNDGDTTFTVRAPTLLVNRTFNDRIAVIDKNP